MRYVAGVAKVLKAMGQYLNNYYDIVGAISVHYNTMYMVAMHGIA